MLRAATLYRPARQLLSCLSATTLPKFNPVNGLRDVRVKGMKYSNAAEGSTNMTPLKAMDNVYWPNGSAVEKALDEEANLAPPNVTGHEWTLTEHDLECLCAGAGIMASGGGGDPNGGFERALKVLLEGKKLKIANPCRVSVEKMSLACTVALMGDPTQAEGGSSIQGTLLALQRVQQAIASEGRHNTVKDADFPVYVANESDISSIDVEGVEMSRKITALTAVETGGFNTIEPLVTSANNGLPYLDVAGQFRSYPKLQMFLPFIYNSPYWPTTVADTDESYTCSAADSCADMEDYFRGVTDSMGDLASIALGAIPFEKIFQKMVLFASSRAWQLGRVVCRAINNGTSVVDAIVDQQKGYVLLTGQITNLDTVSEGGFVKNVTTVEGADAFDGNTLKITALNENYVVQKVDAGGLVLDTLATIPDIITLVNLETSKPMDVAVMAGNPNALGKNVAVIILPTDPRLYTEQALEVMGPRALDNNLPDYQPPKFIN